MSSRVIGQPTWSIKERQREKKTEERTEGRERAGREGQETECKVYFSSKARPVLLVRSLSPTPDTSDTVLQTFPLLCFSLMTRESTHLQLWAEQSQQSVESPFPPGASCGLKPVALGFRSEHSDFSDSPNPVQCLHCGPTFPCTAHGLRPQFSQDIWLWPCHIT